MSSSNIRLVERLRDRVQASDFSRGSVVEYGLVSDFFEMIRICEEENPYFAHELNKEVRDICSRSVYNRELSLADREKFYFLNKRALLFDALDDFDAYIQYLEYDRPAEKKFYLPRRKVLYPIVKDMEALDRRELDFLSVSLPPRVGKSTLGIFFMTWLMGKYPDKSNLMSGHSDILTNGFYKEVLSILTDPQYLWGDIFQGYKITQSALYQTVDVNDGKRRFPTLTCRSIGGTLTGAVEFSKCLYCDDLIRDLEEALSPTRLESKYNNYANLLKDRKVEDGFQLMIGTRWAPNDVQGRIEEQYKDNPRYRFRVIPALDENGESNFQYEQGHGFSTEYYLDMKESIDNATWTAKYMGNPYEREGLLFPTDELNFYNGVLPGTEPDKIVAFCDVAWGGGDSLAMPFAYVYGEDVYIHDVIFNRGDKEQTRPIVVGKIMQHTPHQARFEANNGGDEYCDAVDGLLREKGVKLNLSHRKAPGNMNKIARIVQKSPEIKRMHFLDFKYSNSEYRAFMRELTTFVTTGKNKHDDAPDALAGLATLIDSDAGSIKVFKRPF